ncbi:DUF1648 domain-containing protein [Ideonella sp. 4Y16]|uniref:DUF1648 domain-containing protein n=1 Tax=Ideonella alba TaxID=2824118 RepID=A0A941BF37_9BURK|nr:DUF1648 domain-containing protein [Ideonella alba]MBQ0930647.1 DUF1648 domain-containing protein [Ideonella alba]MBQ0944767.1 DUF1648 domain-containing protein [Ideonella alba]
MNPRLIDALLLATVAAAAAAIWGTGLALPSQIATGFGALGEATGYGERNRHLWMMTLLAVGLPLPLGYGMGLLAGREGQRLSIPQKAYWLAPERRADTLAAMGVRAKVMATLLAAYPLGLHLLIVQAQKLQPPHLPQGLMLALHGALILGMLAWVVELNLRFGRTR